MLNNIQTIIITAAILLAIIIAIACVSSCNGKKKEMEDRTNAYQWEPMASAPVKFPIEVLGADFVLDRTDQGKLHVEELSIFGNPTLHQGIAQGFCGAAYDEDRKVRLPRGIDALWLSYTERKVYSLYADLPFEQMEDLFAKGYERYDSNGVLKQEKFESLDLCFLPKGVVVLYAKGIARTILLDWSALGHETNEFDEEICKEKRAESINELVDWTLEHNPGMVVDKDLPADSLLSKYFERFNYRINVAFEDERSSIFISSCNFTNAERISVRYKSMDNGIKRPARLKDYELLWNCDGYQYDAYFYFNEEESLRLFDEAFGENRKEKEGTLDVKVSKYNNLFEISLNVDDKKILFEKTEIRVFRAPLPDVRGNWELIYKNYEGDHQNILRIE